MADQKRKVAAEKPIMAYVKRPATESASRCMGAARDWAASTSRKMSAMTVASPARSDRTTMLPSQLTVPAVTCSPESRQDSGAPQRPQTCMTYLNPMDMLLQHEASRQWLFNTNATDSAQSIFIHSVLNKCPKHCLAWQGRLLPAACLVAYIRLTDGGSIGSADFAEIPEVLDPQPGPHRPPLLP